MSPLAIQTRLVLRNDLRLLWRDLMSTRWKDFLSVSLIVVLFLIANAIVIPIFFAFRRPPPLGAETIAWLFFGSLMLTTAMNHAIKVLFERSDFDLLLSAPISPRAILLARTAAMSAAAALSVALFLLPLLDGALLAVSFGYAAGYLVWLLLSCAVSSAGVWFTLILVRWLGPRRARVWAQVVAALLGAGVYLVIQGQSFIRDSLRSESISRAMGVLKHPVVAFVARAGRGELLPLLALAAISVVFTALTTRLLARMFIGGVQEGIAIMPGRKRASSRRHGFVEGVARATFWKDVRLIIRDPLLLAQVLPSALYILPAFFGLGRLGGVALLGPVSLVLATQFSLTLTAVAASGEECWDLIRMSPTAELRLRVAKMAAGMALPMIVSALLCFILVPFGHPVLALLGMIFSFGCAAAASWLQVARISPTPRHDIMRRRRSGGQNIMGGIIAAIIMLIGAAGLGFAGSSHWIVATVLLGVTVLLVLACFVFVNLEEVSSREFQSSDQPA
jgi:ABC-2 type transport system permease protein